MPCCENCKTFLFTLLTFIAVGSAVLLFVIAIVFVSINHLTFTEIYLDIYLYIGLGISVIVFLVCIYASWNSESKCTRSFLGIIFIIFLIVVLAIGIVVIAFKDNFLSALGNVFTDRSNEDRQQIQTAFKCCNWGTQKLNCTVDVDQDCQEKFISFYDNFRIGIFISSLVISLLLGIGILLVFHSVCSCCHGKQNNGSRYDPFNTTLSYGW